MFTVLILTIACTVTYAEIVQNANMESLSVAPWHCHGCTASISNDSLNGKQSIMISHRRAGWAGIEQTVQVQPNHNYFFNVHLKLVNLVTGHMYHHISVKFKYTVNSHVHYVRISYSPMQQVSFGYQEIGGDFHVPNGVNSITIYIEINEAGANYLLDDATLQEITPNTNWKAEAQARIEKIKKAPLNIKIENHDNADTSDFKIEIKQVKSSFAFGTAVRADIMMDQNKKAYHDFVYNNFEWATIANNLKWRLMEFTQGHPIWNRGIPALNLLRSKGMKVRGHNMFWGVQHNCPKWILNMTSSDLNNAMHARIHGMMLHTTGKVEHWDVNNVNLHGDFYEQRMSNPNITMKMFEWMRLQDKNMKLFLNEFNVVMDSSATTAYRNQGKIFKTSGVPIYGLGVQSHFHSVPKSIDVVKYRLDKIAEANLPLWITELTIHEVDENKKAAVLEDILTLYFSHSSIQGIIFWGFQESSIHDHAASLTSNDIVPNAAGRKYQELFHKTWRTNEVHPVASTINAKGFLGDYELTLLHQNTVIHTENFTLDNNGANPTFHIRGTGSGVHVAQVAFG
ncbi:uncharacterized protein LOC143076604 [Mytilus galloprovincialis]|uniref:uncharacterized protein LOC143076604 n=1 Tax=Mytilus galloprovincialis TaxID=29158 RepID=UPI003F7B556B